MMIPPQDPGVWRSATTASRPSLASPSPASRGRCGGSSSLTTSSPGSRQTASLGWRSSTSWTYQVTTTWKTRIAGGLLNCSRQQLQRETEAWQQILLESNFLMAFPLKAINIFKQFQWKNVLMGIEGLLYRVERCRECKQ